MLSSFVFIFIKKQKVSFTDLYIVAVLKFTYFLLKDNCFIKFSVFCQTSTWISHRDTYIPLLLNLPPIPLPIPPRLIQCPCLSFLSHTQIPIGYLFYIWQCKFPCYSFHTTHPLLPSPNVHKCILYVCFSTVAL